MRNFDLQDTVVKQNEKSNMSLKEIQKEKNAKDIDPDRLKIMEWTDGKKIIYEHYCVQCIKYYGIARLDGSQLVCIN